MKIKKQYGKKLAQFYDILQKCMQSRDTRRDSYTALRSYYLYGCGTTDNPEQTYNKIYPHIEQLTSLMFSAETTKFIVLPSEATSQIELHKIRTLSRHVYDQWHSSNADIVFLMMLKWAFVYGSTFLKTLWNGEQLEVFPVDPVDFGVLREDVQGLHRQDAFAHSYLVTRHEFERQIEEHPRKGELLRRVTSSPKQKQSMIAGPDRVGLSQTQPIMVGNLNINVMFNNKYLPSVSEDLVEMMELWVWDSEAHDYQIMQFAEPNLIVWDKTCPEMWLPHEPAFTQICPTPDPNYFYGIAEVERLIPLQRLRNERMDQVRHLCNLQTKPPKILSGFSGINDEIATALDSPNAVVTSEIPTAGAKVLQPTIPEDVYKEIREIDVQFEEVSGISGIMQGKGEQGVRSNSHAKNLAQFGSSRARQRALVVEDALEKQATLYLKAEQRYDADTMLRGDDGVAFNFHQFTDDFVVKVDAHSSSPIFVEDNRMLAMELFKAQAITKEALINITDPPMARLLLLELQTKIAPAEQAQAQIAAAQPHKGGGKVAQLPKRG